MEVEKLERSCTAGRGVNGAAALENSLAVPQVVKLQLPYDSAILLLGIKPREMKHMSIRKFVHRCTQQHYSK